MSTGSDSTTDSSGKLHVLVVDDQKDTARMLQLFIRTAGHTVQSAGSKGEALQVADREPFDVMVCDLRLPDGSGHDLMAEMRTRHPSIKGIVFSGLSAPEEMEQSQAAGFSAFLVKPQDLDRLLDVIQDITRRP